MSTYTLKMRGNPRSQFDGDAQVQRGSKRATIEMHRIRGRHVFVGHEPIRIAQLDFDNVRTDVICTAPM